MSSQISVITTSQCSATSRSTTSTSTASTRLTSSTQHTPPAPFDHKNNSWFTYFDKAFTGSVIDVLSITLSASKQSTSDSMVSYQECYYSKIACNNNPQKFCSCISRVVPKPCQPQTLLLGLPTSYQAPMYSKQMNLIFIPWRVVSIT